MKKKNKIIALFRKYAKGDTKGQDTFFINSFFNRRVRDEDFRKGDQEFLIRENEIKNEILDGINSRIAMEKHLGWRSFAWKIAAALALLTVSSYLFYDMMKPDAKDHITWLKYYSASGQRRMVILPDSSIVWLNANSTMSFPEHFTAAERHVVLVGEALFKVTRNEQKPFIVSSANIQTRVLGTTFNINGYERHAPRVTVVEGKVNVSNSNQSIDLIRDEQVSWTANQMVKRSVNAQLYSSWSSGLLTLDNTDVDQVITTLGHWYGVNFIYEYPETKNCRISGKFKIDSLNDVLQSLEYLIHVDHQWKDTHTILITGKACSK